MVNLSAGNAATGALTGASTGSMFGPAGTAIGAGIGGLIGLFGGKKKKRKKISAFDEQQQQLYQQYVDSLSGKGQFADLYNFDASKANNVFDQNVSRPAYRQFQENVIPSITGQFRGGNLQNSSYLGQSLSRAGRDVQEGLDAKRAQYLYQGEQNAQSNKQNAIQNVLSTNTFDYDNTTGANKNVIDEILGAAGPASAEWFANYLRTSKNKANVAGYMPAR